MITLRLPEPLSVNRTRRIDWKNYPKVKAWIKHADGLFLTQKRGLGKPITGEYEITITLRDGSLTDLDNTCKAILDVVRRFGLVTDDDPKHMKRLVVEFGDVEGCRVDIRAFPTD